MARNLKISLLCLTLGLAAYAAHAGSVTISTFYPSPYGSYQNLDTTGATNLATAGGNVIMANTAGGMVGIGVAPTQKLQVAGNVQTSGNLMFSGNNPVISVPNTDLFFSANGNQRLLLDSGGNVGIGNPLPNPPGYTLHVAGNTYVAGNLRLLAGGQQGNLRVNCDGNDCYAVYA